MFIGDFDFCPADFLIQSGPTSVKPNKFNRQKEFSPVVFYGSPHGVPPKKPSRSFLRLLREIRIDLAAQKRLTSRYLCISLSTLSCFKKVLFSCDTLLQCDSTLVFGSFRKEVWTTFPRQDEAMQFAKGHENVHVFSYQDHYSGQRRFLVSTYNDFWRRLPCPFRFFILFHHMRYYIFYICTAFVSFFRYKNMNPKFRHHYEVIQEVTYFPSFYLIEAINGYRVQKTDFCSRLWFL